MWSERLFGEILIGYGGMVVNRFGKFLMRKIGLFLSLVLVSTTFLCGCSAEADKNSKTSGVQENETEQADINNNSQNEDDQMRSDANTSEKSYSDGQIDKTETVYVKADANGSVKEISVEELLKNLGSKETIEDYSTLQDIKNTKGDEEFTRQSDGILLWENHGEDISYKGTSTEELPVSVKVSYYLDGKQTKPEDIAGKSGEVRIRFDYENHTAKTVDVDGKKVQVTVPFAVLSALVLPSDTFSNIEVSGGKVLSMEDQNLVIGFAYPGLHESLGLADYEPTEDISLPDSMEITAWASDFELDFTATVVTSGTFSDLDLSDLDDADELVENMAELTDASSKLVDGTSELLEGAETIQSYMKQYVQGVNAVEEGANALTDGLKTLNTEKSNLETGAAALQTGLENLNTALEQFSFPSSENSQSDSGLSSAADTAALTLAVQSLTSDAQTLASQLAALQKSLNQIQTFAADAAQYTSTVQSTVSLAKSELSASLEELDKINEQANNLAKQQVKDAADQALENMDLTEEEKEELRKKIIDSVDLSDITAPIRGNIETALNQITELPALTIPDFSMDFGDIMNTVNDMQTQMEALQNVFSSLSGADTQLSSLQNALEALKDGVSQLQNGSAQLTQGITAFNQGIEQLYSGSVQLSGGTGELSSAGSSLSDGLNALVQGLQQLEDGIETFDEEGIQSLSELAGDDLSAVITRFKALKEADGSYNNFAGIKDGHTGSVRFIIETEEITATPE